MLQAIDWQNQHAGQAPVTGPVRMASISVPAVPSHASRQAAEQLTTLDRWYHIRPFARRGSLAPIGLALAVVVAILPQ
jgi:hypothetical protein